MAKPQKPRDVFVTNGWWMELPGLISPHFETFSGLKKTTGMVSVVDAGTNTTYHFNNQLKDFGQIQLTRAMNGTVDDIAIDLLVNESIETGLKLNGSMIKKHYGRIVFSIGFEGLFFTEENWPEFNIAGEDKLIKTYSAYVDRWFMIP